jgi:hypothetical protein
MASTHGYYWALTSPTVTSNNVNTDFVKLGTESGSIGKMRYSTVSGFEGYHSGSWSSLGGGGGITMVSVDGSSGTTTTTANNHYVYTASTEKRFVLPSSITVGDKIKFSFTSNSNTGTLLKIVVGTAASQTITCRALGRISLTSSETSVNSFDTTSTTGVGIAGKWGKGDSISCVALTSTNWLVKIKLAREDTFNTTLVAHADTWNVGAGCLELRNDPGQAGFNDDYCSIVSGNTGSGNGTWNFDSGVTYEAWIKVGGQTTNLTYPRIISTPKSSLSASQYVLSLFDGGSDRYKLGWITNNAHNTTLYSTPGVHANLNDGAWHHVAGTHTSGTGRFACFIDGVLVTALASIPSATPTTGLLGTTYLGTFSADYEQPLVGKITEVRLWNTAVSDANITKWYRSYLTSAHDNSANLVAYYNCNLSDESLSTLKNRGGVNDVVCTRAGNNILPIFRNNDHPTFVAVP